MINILLSGENQCVKNKHLFHLFIFFSNKQRNKISNLECRFAVWYTARKDIHQMELGIEVVGDLSFCGGIT